MNELFATLHVLATSIMMVAAGYVGYLYGAM